MDELISRIQHEETIRITVANPSASLADNFRISIPLSVMPASLQNAAKLFPTYWLSTALSGIQIDGVGSSYWLSMLILMSFSAAFLLFGSKERLE